MQKKILCLGTNSELTDRMSSSLANEHSYTNHGLIDRHNLNDDFQDGVYHTSLADVSAGDVLELAQKFDLIVMLDQDRQQWSHWKLLQTTYKTMVNLESLGHSTQFRTNKNVVAFEKLQGMIQNNPSWCIFPWINLVTKDQSGMVLCSRSTTQISNEYSMKSWIESPQKAEIQNSMLKGELLPQHCNYCYQYESKGIESYRQYESLDWCNQLDISDFDDLNKITTPKHYEVHWSNKCNLRCRGCYPSRSSAIEVEFKKHHVIMPFKDTVPESYPAIDVVDIPGLDRTSRVYMSGGEPAIMPETVEFMQRCIDAGRTDFELTMSTNGVKFPQKFLELSRHFENFNFSFSLDGYGPINDYWRSGSRWESIVSNMHLMKSMGHSVTVNTVPGIYNVTNLHLLLEWLDREFPMTGVYMQVNHVGFQSAYNHPDRAAVIDSMHRCQQTRMYWSDAKSCRSSIDSILEYYQGDHDFNRDDLRTFFQYNDTLDKIRGVMLGDYIPELEACRKFI